METAIVVALLITVWQFAWFFFCRECMEESCSPYHIVTPAKMETRQEHFLSGGLRCFSGLRSETEEEVISIRSTARIQCLQRKIWSTSCLYLIRCFSIKMSCHCNVCQFSQKITTYHHILSRSFKEALVIFLQQSFPASGQPAARLPKFLAPPREKSRHRHLNVEISMLQGSAQGLRKDSLKSAFPNIFSATAYQASWCFWFLISVMKNFVFGQSVRFSPVDVRSSAGKQCQPGSRCTISHYTSAVDPSGAIGGHWSMGSNPKEHMWCESLMAPRNAMAKGISHWNHWNKKSRRIDWKPFPPWVPWFICSQAITDQISLLSQQFFQLLGLPAQNKQWQCQWQCQWNGAVFTIFTRYLHDIYWILLDILLVILLDLFSIKSATPLQLHTESQPQSETATENFEKIISIKRFKMI